MAPRENLSCDLCTDYETYKKDNLDIHVKMAHKYKKEEKSNLASIAETINNGSSNTAQSTPAAQNTCTYVPRRRNPLFDCRKCIFRFLTQSGLDAHVEKDHSPDDPDIDRNAINGCGSRAPYTPRRRSVDYKCQKCPESSPSVYLSQDGLDGHMVKEHGEEPKPKSDSDRSSSQESAPPPEPRPYVPRRRNPLYDCQKCIYRFLSQDGLDAHYQKDHHPDDPIIDRKNPPPQPPSTYQPRRRTQDFKCQKCPETSPSVYLTQDGLDGHMEKEHKPKDPVET